MQTKRIVFVSCWIFVFNSVSSEYEILDGDGWGKSLFAFVDYLYPEYTLPSRWPAAAHLKGKIKWRR